MSKSNTYCVYMHTSPNGKKYIGITQQSPSKRWQSGNGYRRNRHFWGAIKKYGWDNFEHSIIKENISKQEACDLERSLISFYETTDDTKGYNISTGGESGGIGTRRTEEQREKFAKNARELWKDAKYREKTLKARQGYVCTEEHRSNLSQALKGHGVSEKTKNRISKALKQSKLFHQNRKTWNKGKHYTNEQKLKFASTWAPKTEETKEKIREGVSKLWMSDEYRQHMKSAHIGKGCKKVLCKELNQVFNSLKEAQAKTGVKYDCISRCCHGKSQTAGTYHWEFI